MHPVCTLLRHACIISSESAGPRALLLAACDLTTLEPQWKETRKFMESIKMFDGLPAPLKDRLSQAIVPEFYGPADFVVKQGRTGRSMYIVKKGQLQVVADDAVISIIGPPSSETKMHVKGKSIRNSHVQRFSSFSAIDCGPNMQVWHGGQCRLCISTSQIELSQM